MAKERIGFIGVGLMGHGMAKNLVDKGHPLTIHGNPNRQPVDDLVKRGASEVKTPAEIAKASDIVFLCVTDSTVVEKMVKGPNGLKEGAHRGMVIVDWSTADPNSTIALAAEMAERCVHYADAPLGGTPAQAEEGLLSAMIGADPAVFERIKPVCALWAGTKVVHLGPVGDGHKVKLLNNFLAMGYAAIYAEALTLGKHVGISPQTFDSVIRGSRMDCGFYQTFFKYVLERDRNAHQFTLRNAYKDVRYLEDMAQAIPLPNPVGNAVKNAYAAAVAAGKGDDYVPTISDFVAGQSGVKLTAK
jgi:3-hydroxyisobutyrate dehydrogenase-like beta-hydroxyacid dehydrogenase